MHCRGCACQCPHPKAFPGAGGWAFRAAAPRKRGSREERGPSRERKTTGLCQELPTESLFSVQNSSSWAARQGLGQASFVGRMLPLDLIAHRWNPGKMRILDGGFGCGGHACAGASEEAGGLCSCPGRGSWSRKAGGVGEVGGQRGQALSVCGLGCRGRKSLDVLPLRSSQTWRDAWCGWRVRRECGLQVHLGISTHRWAWTGELGEKSWGSGISLGHLTLRGREQWASPGASRTQCEPSWARMLLMPGPYTPALAKGAWCAFPDPCPAVLEGLAVPFLQCLATHATSHPVPVIVSPSSVSR